MAVRSYRVLVGEDHHAEVRWRDAGVANAHSSGAACRSYLDQNADDNGKPLVALPDRHWQPMVFEAQETKVVYKLKPYKPPRQQRQKSAPVEATS